ncbi:(R)-citramalate synthase [Anaerolineaceae bacterium]|nr:(R)-citramalate synthase [Anaerolineaceae bacterium]
MAASSADVSTVLAEIKQLEAQGFSFEAAEASVALRLRRRDRSYRAPFELVDFVCTVEHRQGRGLVAEASVKVSVAGGEYHTVADGNGPVKRAQPRAAQGTRAHVSAHRGNSSLRLQGAHFG